MPTEQKGSAGKFIAVVGLITLGLLLLKIGLDVHARMIRESESATMQPDRVPVATTDSSATALSANAAPARPEQGNAATLDEGDVVTPTAPRLVGSWACRVGQLVSDLRVTHVQFNDMPEQGDGAYVRAFYPDGRLFEKFHNGTRGYGAWKTASDVITDSGGNSERLVYVKEEDLFYSFDMHTLTRAGDGYQAIGARCRRRS